MNRFLSAIRSATSKPGTATDRFVGGHATKTMLITSVLVCIGLLLNAMPARAAEASCYGPGLWGNHTADGRVLNRGTIGVAHKTLPLGTKLRIHANGRTVTATVIDRGPYVPGRALDLTEALARLLGYEDCTWWGHRQVRTWRAR